MNGDDLANLLAQYDKPQENLPFAFIHQHPGDPKSGIDMAIFLFWAERRGLLVESGVKTKKNGEGEFAFSDFENLVAHALSLTGSEIRPSFFNENGLKFAYKYLRPGWRYEYHADLDAMFPAEKSYSEMPEKLETLNAIFALLDKRFFEIASEERGK